MVGTATQEASLLHGTLEENIRFGRPNATREEVIRACEQALAFEFIQSLEQGLDTIVGNGGQNLSNGERQRIALARALLTNPELLILDESTNALDSGSQQSVQQNLLHFAKGRTVIYVAHALSIVTHVDKIFFLKSGQLVEEGKHSTLLERQGEYWNHWQILRNGYHPA